MSVAATLARAVARTFTERPWRTALLVALGGSALAFFYAIALPAERYGAFALGALAYLTPAEALAAIIIGYGTTLAIAINLGSNAARGSDALTFGGALAALLPSSLCCTTLIPSALAALGASAPVVLHTTGRFQGFFAAYSNAFIAFAVLAVLAALWLAARSSRNACPLPSSKGRPQ